MLSLVSLDVSTLGMEQGQAATSGSWEDLPVALNRRLLVTLGIVLATLVTHGPAAAKGGAANGEWGYYAGDIGATKYSPLDHVN